MKVLLFGKRGQVGWELQRSLSLLGDVIALDQADTEGLVGDFSNLSGISETIRRVAPDIIVNASAYTAVDKAESDKALALRLNAEAPSVLAKESKALDALLVHYSTDYVFDGGGVVPRSETDETGPINYYGFSKLEGEKRVIESGCRYLLFRTSWVYASRGGNFVKTILKLAESRESLKVVGDQIGSPTSAELIADATAFAVKRVAATELEVERELLGTYNLVADGETSWHNFAQSIVSAAIENGAKLVLRPESIEKITTAEFPTAAKRPLNSRLSTEKIKSRFGLYLPHWRVGLSRVIGELCEGI